MLLLDPYLITISAHMHVHALFVQEQLAKVMRTSGATRMHSCVRERLTFCDSDVSGFLPLSADPRTLVGIPIYVPVHVVSSVEFMECGVTPGVRGRARRGRARGSAQRAGPTLA
eukprot:SAG25_NODE_727_length_5698_cov_2.832649_6_plen_114_part_00